MKIKNAIVLGERTAFLMRESATPKVLEPLTPEEQQKQLPPGLKNPVEWLEKHATGVDIHYLDQQKKRWKALRKANQEELHDACMTLLDLPAAFAKALPVAQLVLLALLSLVIDLALPHLPGVPIAYFSILGGVPNLLRKILHAISGPDIQCGKKWELKRPTALLPFVPLGETAPALVPETYVGGWFKDWRGRKHHFWLPYHCQAIIIAPNFPHKLAEKIIGASPLAIFIVCGTQKFQAKERMSLTADGSTFLTFDPLMADQFGRFEELIRAEIQDFVQWLRAKKKRWRAWLDDVGGFLPKTNQGRFLQVSSAPDAQLLACCLALFKAFLSFAVEKRGWLTMAEAQQFLLDYWCLVLPESAPATGAGYGGQVGNCRWNDPLTFWTFLSGYISEHATKISADGAPVKQEIVVVLHRLSDVPYIIFPRSPMLQAYVSWLQDRRVDIPEQGGRWETQVQSAIMNGGIAVKTEGEDISWRFAFYRKGQAPAGLKEKLPCLAFPLAQLPPEVITALKSALGPAFTPWSSDLGQESEVASNG